VAAALGLTRPTAKNSAKVTGRKARMKMLELKSITLASPARPIEIQARLLPSLNTRTALQW
jgi:hypothetical protein